jgi:hypothetical protein
MDYLIIIEPDEKIDIQKQGWAMVKRCGKSAPRSWQQFRQGKPHRLKDQAAGARPGHYRRVGRLSRLATVGPDKWLSSTELGLQTRSFNFHFKIFQRLISECFLKF